MKTLDEVKKQRNEFEAELRKAPESQELEAIVDALNWVLDDSEALEDYKSI